MRHRQSGRKLGVDSSHRDALLRSLCLALIEQDHIRTTTARAKELRMIADRIVTLGKRGDLHSRRRMLQMLGTNQTKVPGENRVRNAMEKVYTLLVPRFKDRPGGYTQILHLAGRRAGDNAEMSLIRYLPPPETEKKKASKEPKKPTKKAPESGNEKAVKASPKDKGHEKHAHAKHDHKHDHKHEPEDKPAKAKKKDKEKEG